MISIMQNVYYPHFLLNLILCHENVHFVDCMCNVRIQSVILENHCCGNTSTGVIKSDKIFYKLKIVILFGKRLYK